MAGWGRGMWWLGWDLLSDTALVELTLIIQVRFDHLWRHSDQIVGDGGLTRLRLWWWGGCCLWLELLLDFDFRLLRLCFGLLLCTVWHKWRFFLLALNIRLSATYKTKMYN